MKMENAKLAVVSFETQDVICTSGETKGYYASWAKLGDIHYGRDGSFSVIANGLTYVFDDDAETLEAVINVSDSTRSDLYSAITSATIWGSDFLSFYPGNATSNPEDFADYIEITDGSMMQDVYNWLFGQGLVSVQ